MRIKFLRPPAKGLLTSYFKAAVRPLSEENVLRIVAHRLDAQAGVSDVGEIVVLL